VKPFGLIMDHYGLGALQITSAVTLLQVHCIELMIDLLIMSLVDVLGSRQEMDEDRGSVFIQE